MKKDKLWAPWRQKYIIQAQARKTRGCLFCKIAKPKKIKRDYVIHRTKFSFLMLNTFPYNNGHLMIAPYKHAKDFDGLKIEELSDLIGLLRLSYNLLDDALKPDGYNIGINLAKAGGAGFTGHIHIHIVPRWNGDTNFMPVISNTKVISESLDSVYERLKKCLQGKILKEKRN